MNDVISEEPEPPPKFPVNTGVAAGLWIAYACVLSALQATSLAGVNNRAISSDLCCCLPLSWVFLVAGVMTMLGLMTNLEFIASLGLIIGTFSVFYGVAIPESAPVNRLVLIVTGLLLILAYNLAMSQSLEYNRWALARKWQNRDNDDL